MKRWTAWAMLGVYAVFLLVPLWPGHWQAPQSQPEPAPPRPLQAEPAVELLQSRTGRRVTLPMEEYLLGVLAAEMGEEFPPAALAAQAIVARTYTLRRILRGDQATDDIRTFQAYNPELIAQSHRDAVAATRGLVLTYGGELIEALYHACAGGLTATASEGLGLMDLPYLQPVPDPPCPANETWSVAFSQAAVAAAAGVNGPLWQVALGGTGASGRALTLLVNGQAVSALDLRRNLGGTQLKSTRLTGVEIADGRVRFSGRGFGHGVGLSQWGAAIRAEQGSSPAEILLYYYPGVQVERRW